MITVIAAAILAMIKFVGGGLAAIGSSETRW